MINREYQECLEMILHHEGGYVNHPSDPGGETNLGVTKKVYDPNNIELDFSDPKARRAAYESCATKGEVMAGASLEYKYAADKHLAVLLRKLR